MELHDSTIASDTDVERIASGLMKYLKEDCMFSLAAKTAICEALYEMKAIAEGKPFEPTVLVNGKPPHHQIETKV